jgi:alpha-L-fucosidase
VTADWFAGARFGLFIHWGPASLHGWELSWPLVGGNKALPYATPVPPDVYHRDARSFSPQKGAAREWMRLARRAGMRYAVLTTKHHDGFALFPTAHTDWSIAATPYGGDLVGEYVEAARAEGLRVGFYLSLSDWHHPDYPAFDGSDASYFAYMVRRPSPDAWQRYLGVLRGQLEELLTRYGKIDLLWFDGGWERRPDEWQASELDALIRGLQPEIVINDRLPSVGDYRTPEQLVPAVAPEGPWETCLTMNKTWGWCPRDTNYKSACELVHTLCEVAGRGGNLLLNVSPMADGRLPDWQVERLEAIAGWMARHGAAIHDSAPGLEPWQFYGPSTRSGETIRLCLPYRPYESVTVRGIRTRRVRAVRDLATGTPLAHRERLAALDELINSDPEGELVIDVPERLVDPLATVIEVELRPDAG